MKFTLNRKSLMKFGKWSLALFSLVLLGFFVYYIIPILALGTPTQTVEINVSLNTPADGAYSNAANVNFTYNTSWNTANANITNCTLVGNFTDGSWIMNTTNTTDIMNNVFNGINMTLSDGPYLWNIYCYNVTGAGSNVGANGTESNRTVIVDTTDPNLNATTPADGAYINGSSNQLFQVYGNDSYFNYTNVSMHWRSCSAFSDYPASCGGWQSKVSLTCYNVTTNNISFVCNNTVDLSGEPEGYIIAYYFEASDNATNLGTNGTASSPLNATIDQTAPNPSAEDATPDSPTSYAPSKNYVFNITWADGSSGVDEVIFEWNKSSNKTSGTSPAVESQGSGAYGITITNLEVSTANYTYKWFANDTVLLTENWNVTPTYTYNVTQNTSISTYLHIKLNDTTTDNDKTYTYPNQVNATGYKNISEGTLTLYRNDTNVTCSNGLAENTTTLQNATWNFTVYYPETQNYTASSRTVWVYMEKGVTNITYYINGTDTGSNANKTIASGSPINITVVVNNSEGAIRLYRADNLVHDESGSSLINETTYTGYPGQEWNITAIYNGSQNYSASSSIWNYLIIESTSPTYTNLDSLAATSATLNNATNSSIIGKYGGSINISAQWTDGFELDSFWLSNDSSGSWVNSTDTAFSATTANWTNITINPSIIDLGVTFNATIYANDTSGNENVTLIYQWTIDNTNPVVNTTTPSNNTYINGSDDQLFQVYVYDDTLNTTNVSLYWKPHGGGWQDRVGLTCINLTLDNVSFVCNNTVDLHLRPEGEQIDYYFEATDYSKLYNSSGTRSDPLFVTIDKSAPAYSNNNTNVTVVGKYDTVLIYANWTDATSLDMAILETNETGSWQNKSITAYKSPFDINLTAGQTWSNFTWSNSSLAVGTVIEWKIYANDTVGHQNVTGNGSFSIDNTKPTYANNGTNVTSGVTIVRGTVINVSATWTDNIKLSQAWVQHNFTGAMQNESVSFNTDSGNMTEKTLQNTSSTSVGIVFEATIFANDTSGNENYTIPTWTWTVDETPPTYGNKSDTVDGESMYAPGATIYINISWADDLQVGNISTVLLNISSESTNQTTTNLGSGNYSVELTDLAVGNYTYKWFANDTSDNWNSTIVYTLNISQNTTTSNYMNLTLGNATTVQEANNTLMYPETNNATGYYNSSVLGGQTISFILYKNGTEVGTTNPISDTTRYAVNTVYNYTYNTSGNANYTSASKEFWLTVVQNNTNPIDIYLVNTTGTFNNTNATESAGQSVTINATAIYGNETELKLFQNGTQVSNPYTYTYPSAAVYNFTATIVATNYTANASVPTFWLTITEDTTGPTIELYDYMNGTAMRSGDYLTLNISVSDATGVNHADTCNVTIAGVTNRTITFDEPSGWCNGTISVPSVNSDGNYTINITVNDNSTNTNMGENSSYILTVDNTTPVITITFPVNGTYNKTESSGYIWINGTVYDHIKMGTGNVTINSTYFNASLNYGPYNFTGTNDTAFVFRNQTYVPDGYYAVKINYSDNATNTGEAIVYFYVDNTPPTSISANTTGTKPKNSSQVVRVTVVDEYMTNASITLHYCRIWYDRCSREDDTNWETTTMTGTPAANTVYNATINTSQCENDEKVYYYVTGIDNATNPFTGNGSASSPLGSFNISSTTAIEGYIIQNSSSTTYISGATVSVNKTGFEATTSGSDGYYYIDGLTAGGYIVMVNKTDYLSNQSEATTVTVGSTSQVNVTIANNATGVIEGYVYLTNTTIATNSSVLVSDGTRSANTNTNGYYQITGVPAGTHTLTISGNGYWTNITSATVSAGQTTTANGMVTGAENFNVTIPGSSTSSYTVSGFLDPGETEWPTCWLQTGTGMFSSGTTNYTIESLFSSMGVSGSYNYSSVWRYNSTTDSWSSFIPGQTPTLTNVTSGSELYYIHVNRTDRVEIEARYT